MEFTVARLAELRRATLLSTSKDEYGRFLMSESAHCVGSNPGSMKENQISSTKPQNSGRSAMLRNISRLMILAKPQDQQCNLLASARLTPLPPLEQRQLLNSQNIMLVVYKLIDSLITMTPPPQQGNTMTRTITLKAEKCLARLMEILTMKKMKNMRDHHQKRLNMREPMLNREYQALMGFFLQA
ncbi:MAG: hypothetical protein EZS28_044584 [Streblomastix strix]|uniref:Uncharacterized protein n=1 Tax=Streblomastix strix TaxID=222440 RepID=A0A5J4TPR2_9EUKA|nr:MAG: hypothetical protein EZS28_044584 [Streblomastix strix]